MNYRKKPIVIEAIQYNNLNREEIEAFVGKELKQEIESDTAYVAGQGSPSASLTIQTLEGDMKAMPGDWIIKGVKGEFYPCKKDIFEATYDPTEYVEEESSPTNNLDFGQAIRALKAGKKAAREGWNGKGMFIFMRPSDEIGISAVIDVIKSLPSSVKEHYRNEDAARDGSEQGLTKIKFTAYLCMKAADGTIVNGWLASQTDMLAEDWMIIE